MSATLESYFTTTTIAAELGVTSGRVRAMIAAGRLRAIRLGREWLIDSKALADVRSRKPGRPVGIRQTRVVRAHLLCVTMENSSARRTTDSTGEPPSVLPAYGRPYRL